MKIDFWGHKRKKNGLKKDTAIALSCYCVIRDGGMGKMPGKSGKEAFSWGKRGRLGWLRRKLLQETEMEKLETLKDLSRSVPIFSK